MKRYFLLLVLLFGAVSLHAQKKLEIVGDFSVVRKTLCERNGELYMVLDVEVSRRAVTRSQSWTIIPELSTPDRQSVKLFPHIVINGRYQQHMQERRRTLTGRRLVEREPLLTINVDGDTDRTYTYEMKVPYESWMADATLVLRQIQTNPGGRRRIFTVDINGAVDTQK